MPTVLIFDSGVGGLSISQKLTEILPDVEQIFLADNAYFPYGEKDEQAIIQRVTSLLTSAAEKMQPDCIVVACNTVSTVALDSLRNLIEIPIIGVVPAIKPAALMSLTKVIALLATPATVASDYTAELVEQYANDCEVINIASTRLVKLAESYMLGHSINTKELREIIAPLLRASSADVDVLILGCTHFPLVANLLRKVLPESIKLIDSSAAIGRQVASILKLEPIELEQSVRRKIAGDKNNNFKYFMTGRENSSLDASKHPSERYGFSQPVLFDF